MSPSTELLDRLLGSVPHRDQRPLDEALILVADHHQVAVLGGEQLQQPVLGVVGVLVLVDEDVAEGAAPALAHLLEQLQRVDRAD